MRDPGSGRRKCTSLTSEGEDKYFISVRTFVSVDKCRCVYMYLIRKDLISETDD